MIESYINKHKVSIESTLVEFLKHKKEEASVVNRWGGDITDHLKDAVHGGKMIRGVLIIMGYELSHREFHPDIYKVAAAYELFHSGFLIHDDVIDGDNVRRGKSTMHKAMNAWMNKKNIYTNDHYGESLAIGVGDIAFFWAYELLLSIHAFPTTIQVVSQQLSKEMANVVLGEIDDVILSLEETLEDEDLILNCFRFKTARYTFSVPLSIGGVLGGVKEHRIGKLQELGEVVGLAFQLKDDELGIFGNEKETGKPVGNDIKEGKQTLYYYYLLKHSDADEQKKLTTIFGNKQATSDDITYVQHLIRTYGIDKKIQKAIAIYVQKAEKSIDMLEIEDHFKVLFKDLIAFVTRRSR